MLDELFLTTDLVDPRLRTEAWREIARPFFEVTQCADGAEAILEGSVRSRLMGTLLIGPTSFNEQQYRRDRRLVLRSGLDHYLIQLFVAGRLEGDCDGQTIAVAPGDIYVFDLARTYGSRVCPGSTISITLPREQIDKAAGGRSLHGALLKAGSPMTRVLADFMVSLSELAADMDSTEALAVEGAAISFLASALAGRVPTTAPGDPAAMQVLRRSVLTFIDANLSAPQLGPALLMRRFRVARAHLYRIFADDGGVAKVIRDRRLDAAYRKLTHHGVPACSITEVAHDLGFSSSGQFLRAFRSRFAMTPTEARSEGFSSALADRGLSDVQAHFAKYARQIEMRHIAEATG